jgi:hypothetical protein
MTVQVCQRVGTAQAADGPLAPPCLRSVRPFLTSRSTCPSRQQIHPFFAPLPRPSQIMCESMIPAAMTNATGGAADNISCQSDGVEPPASDIEYRGSLSHEALAGEHTIRFSSESLPYDLLFTLVNLLSGDCAYLIATHVAGLRTNRSLCSAGCGRPPRRSRQRTVAASQQCFSRYTIPAQKTH